MTSPDPTDARGKASFAHIDPTADGCHWTGDPSEVDTEPMDGWAFEPACPMCHMRVHRQREAGLLALLAKLPPGVLEPLVRVLEHGAAKYGCAPNESGGGQLAGDNIRHAQEHLERTWPIRTTEDPATGALDLIHAIARLWLAASMVEQARQEPGR